MNHKLRIVLDTNLLVSALFFEKSVPTAVLMLVTEDTRFEMIHSYQTLYELRDVLTRSKFDKYLGIDKRLAFVRQITQLSYHIVPTVSLELSRDPKDNMLLELALSGEARYLVTGDKDLLVLQTIQTLQIVTPAIFLQLDG
jgi:putative PIN family toxin of toxin-antitoxin system